MESEGRKGLPQKVSKLPISGEAAETGAGSEETSRDRIESI